MAYKKKVKKKVRREIESVIAHVKASFNNTLVAITAMNGDVIARGSAGQLGFKGARKGTPFAATQITTNLAKDLVTQGVKNVEINLQGPGQGRDSVVRAFQSSGLIISMLRDVTPLPHNGCRPPKKRRV